jgi:alkylation response protein AidB-like acyl-CoA dehydrogenase
MARDYAELHGELRSVARELLAKGDPGPGALAQAGWTGLEIPDALGGAAVSFAETAVILEELGRAGSATGYLGTTLGIGALLELPADGARDGWLTAAAAGEPSPVAVLSTGDTAGIVFTLKDSQLDGFAEFVADAATAPLLLVLARDSGGTPVLAAVAPDADGVAVTDQPVLDETRRLSTVRADGAPVRQVWHFAGDPETAAQRLADRAAVAVACDSLGVAEAMLAATVDYVSVRHQFGRPIGSFQAVKHACADMAVRIRLTRQLVDVAVDELCEGVPASRAASMAKAYACDTAVQVAGKAMQLHGGIGYTWESGVHVYLKRAALNRSLFGSPTAHRKALAVRYG